MFLDVIVSGPAELGPAKEWYVVLTAMEGVKVMVLIKDEMKRLMTTNEFNFYPVFEEHVLIKKKEIIGPALSVHYWF